MERREMKPSNYLSNFFFQITNVNTVVVLLVIVIQYLQGGTINELLYV